MSKPDNTVHLGKRFKPYSEYKNPMVLGVDTIPVHWQVRRVSHVFRVGSGTTPDSESNEYYGGTMPWVTTSELRENVIFETEKQLTEAALRDYSSLHIYPRNSLVIAMYGATIGRLGILGTDATVNQACCVLARPQEVDVRFVFYWFVIRRPILISRGSGGGQPNLSQDLVRSERIAVPCSVAEQRRIARFLDRETAKIDALVAQKERLIELLQEKRAAIIIHAVTRGLDPNAPMKNSGVDWLGEIPYDWDVMRNKRLFREIDSRSVAGEEELLTVSHITGVTRRSEKNVTMIEPESHEGYKRCSTGDLVINTMWAWMGALGVAKEDGMVSPNYNVYRMNGSSLIPRYLDYLCRIPAHVIEIIRYSNGVWRSRLRLYPEEFFQICSPLPPRREQIAIADFLDNATREIDRLIEKIGIGVERLQEYRTALISAAVTGKIDLREQGTSDTAS